MQRAFVTGGSGFLGARLIEMLTAQGVEVAALARSDAARATVAARGARPVAGDLSDPGALQAALQGVDVVFHAAAHLHFWGDRRHFTAVNIEATLALIAVAKAAGVKRFVHVSAASVVMRDRAAMPGVDETAPLTDRRHMPYSATKAMAERAALARSSAAMPVTAVRPPLIWGPGDTFDRALGDRIKAGRFAYFGGGRHLYAVCHVDNACHGAILAARRGRGGEAYFIADAEVTANGDFLDRRIDAAGLRRPARSVPSGLAWGLAGVMEAAWRLLPLRGEPPITREVVRLMGYGFTLDLAKAEAELGYRPLVTRAEGMAALEVREAATRPVAAPAETA